VIVVSEILNLIECELRFPQRVAACARIAMATSWTTVGVFFRGVGERVWSGRSRVRHIVRLDCHQEWRSDHHFWPSCICRWGIEVLEDYRSTERDDAWSHQYFSISSLEVDRLGKAWLARRCARGKQLVVAFFLVLKSSCAAIMDVPPRSAESQRVLLDPKPMAALKLHLVGRPAISRPSQGRKPWLNRNRPWLTN
jgi:hypothetical protein